MAYQDLNIGSSANDGNGDTLRAGGTKIKANFGEIYARFGSGSSDGATLEAATSANLLVGNGTKFASVTSSGDFNISSAGAINVRTTGAVSKITIPSGSAPGSTSNTLYNIGGALYFNGSVVGSGNVTGMTAFSVTGDSGSAQSIAQGNTVTIAGGTGLASVASATDTITLNIDATVATLTGSQTLTSKSLTAPILTGSSSAAGSILFKEDTDNGTNAVTLIGPAATADVTVVLPASAGTIALTSDITVTASSTTTFTNKTLTTPVIASLQQASGSNTLTMPAATDTLVGKATTDTLTNKTLTAPKIVDAGFIADANGAEQIIFQTTASAVNEIEITNSATGGSAIVATSTAPIIGASGETNVDLALLPKGTGYVTVRSTTGSNNQGAIRLNCENNTHGQTVMSQPHASADSSYFMLPKGSSAGNARATPDVLLSADKTVGTSETVTSSGAVSVDTLVTLLNSAGGVVALTLAAGVAGQIKIISMITAGNAATMTIANGNLAGMSTSIVWDAVGEGVTLMYNGAKWVVVGNYGVTIS